MRPIRLAVLAAAVLLAPAARADDSLRCDGGVVSLGDSKLDLLGKCGEPTLRDDRPVEAVAAAQRLLSYVVERWTYDFGPSRFAMTVTMRLGKVTAIERGGRGYAEPGPRAPVRLRRARCEPYAIREGDTTLDLLGRCGDPALREEAVETCCDAVDVEDPAVVRTTLHVEVWTYDFGPSALQRRVRLEDGKVVRVDTGGRGYAE